MLARHTLKRMTHVSLVFADQPSSVLAKQTATSETGGVCDRFALGVLAKGVGFDIFTIVKQIVEPAL